MEEKPKYTVYTVAMQDRPGHDIIAFLVGF